MESFRTFSSLELVRANACNRYVSIPTGFSSAIIIMPQMECVPLTSLISNL